MQAVSLGGARPYLQQPALQIRQQMLRRRPPAASRVPPAARPAEL